MGQDIAEYGGVFKITDGFVEEFGVERVRNTPLCESAIVGIGLGLSLKKYKAMIEMQFGGFCDLWLQSNYQTIWQSCITVGVKMLML